MKNPEHNMTRCGCRRCRCRRCALGARDNGGYCPPGYWMTKAELARWNLAEGTSGQRAIESAAIARRKTLCAVSNVAYVIKDDSQRYMCSVDSAGVVWSVARQLDALRFGTRVAAVRVVQAFSNSMTPLRVVRLRTTSAPPYKST